MDMGWRSAGRACLLWDACRPDRERGKESVESETGSGDTGA